MQTQTVRADEMRQEQGTASPAEAPLHLEDMAIVLCHDTTDIRDDWARLEAFHGNSLHQGYTWCRTWCDTHKTPLLALTGKVNGVTTFVLPLEIVREKGLRIARFPGATHNNINTGLFDPRIGVPDEDALCQFTRRLRTVLAPVADMLVLDCMPRAWRGHCHPLSALATIESQNHAFQLPLLASFDATIDQLNAKTRRKKFRAQMRKLDAIGGFDHVVATASAERHELLDTFFRQKRERLKLLGLPDVFHDNEIRNFFHGLLDAPAASRNSPLTIHALRLKGEAHAGHIPAVAGLSRKGDHIICQFSSIDESICPEASPGELLFWHMIEKACKDGAAIFDFGVGDQLYKRSWCTQESVQHNILLPLTLKGAVARPLLALLTRAKAGIKKNKRIYGLLQRVRAARR